MVCIECCEDGATDDLCACADIQTENPADSKFLECCKYYTESLTVMLILSFSQIKIQLVSALSDHGAVKSRMNAFHSINPVAIVLGMTAATETELDVEMSAFTSLTETMRNLTATAFASRRVRNAT